MSKSVYHNHLLGEHEVPKKYKVHEDVSLSKEEEEAVDVLPKDTFYCNITKKDGEVQTESCFAKMRWGEMNNDENKDDNDIYDDNTKTINLSKKRATEMRSNQRVRLAEPNCDDAKETKRDNLKVEICNTYSKYIEENCKSNGEIKLENNTTRKNPMKALNSIKEKVIDQKLVAVPTDKTNKLSFMSTKTYF